MTQPTCAQCDCVAGCQSRERLCPNLAQPTLVDAAQAVLDRWNSPKWEWTKQGPTGDLMHALREAIAQPVQPALKDQEINALWADALKYGDPTAGNAHIRFARALLAQPPNTQPTQPESTK